MIRIMILTLLVGALLACGLFRETNEPAASAVATPVVRAEVQTAQADNSAEQADDPTPQVGEPAPVPPPTGGSAPSVATVARPAAPFHGDALIEEKIIRSAVVVKATMTSFSSEVIVDADNKNSAVLKFNLNVSEYLKGAGPSSIVAVWVDGRSYDTRKEADDAKTVILAERDDQWDDREAVIFLFDEVSGFGTLLDGQLQLTDHFLLAFGDPYSPDDRYSLHSKTNKDWLPAATVPSSTGDDQEFLLAVPNPNLNTPTITLGSLKSRIREVTSELSGGDGSDAYKECVKEKYRFERVVHYFREEKGEDAYDKSPTNSDFMSGQAANTMLYERQNYGIYPDVKARTWLEGRDAALFTVVSGESTPNDSNGDGVLTAGVDGISYMESFLAVRPLPRGEYKIDRKEVWIRYLQCNYALSHDWTVTVTALVGTSHELFFDPVTVGSTVVADATNGVLKPSSFTDSNGASVTIESISYESGTVRVKANSYTSIVTYVFDFIELDGSVSLSLTVSKATADVGSNTLIWSVSSQPWEDGDKLMVRMRSGAAFAPAPGGLTAAASGRDAIKLSWNSVGDASGYQVQRRESGEETWETVDASVAETAYTVSGLSCGTGYDFRVGAYGRGFPYGTETGIWSELLSEPTGLCSGPPVFDAASYSFELSEGAVAGTQVGTVSATDPDAGDTVAYSITSGNDAGKFAIDDSTGIITVAGSLDYDTASSYTLTVQADDGNGGTGTVTVAIAVIEVVVDATAPVFGAAAYAFSVIEGASVGSTVGAVSATDPNEGDTVAYSVTVGNDAGKFAIDGSTGRITLAATLDYQTASSYTLTVEASDGKGGKGTATVTVSVELASCSNGTAVASPSDNAGLVADCLTLLALRDSLEGTVVLNWSSDVAIGKWKGVGVAGTPGRVQSMALSDLGLNGTVPAGLGDLAELRTLDLSDNELTGAVPSALGKLSKLTRLWLHENGLSGEIPSELGSLTGLESLRMGDNQLTGDIPTQLGELARLHRLSLDDNRLTGSIPASLTRLSNLQTLALSDNKLSGTIPVGLGSLRQLRYLSLGGNALTGSVPSQLGSLSNLQYLYLDNNDLTGGIPTQLGSLAKLEILGLNGNNLTGGIPSDFGGLSNLEELMLSRNGLTGSIPSSLERLSKLVYLRLSGNQLTGCIPAGLRSVRDNDLGRLGLAYCAPSSS